MRIMAIDYGDARTGVAVSDCTATLAGEAWVIRAGGINETARAVAVEAESRDVTTIVVGYPRNMNGTVGPRAELCGEFAELLRGLCGIEVALWDERMTTLSAHRILSNAGKNGKKRKQAVDAVAASLILEGYLEFRRNSK